MVLLKEVMKITRKIIYQSSMRMWVHICHLYKNHLTHLVKDYFCDEGNVSVIVFEQIEVNLCNYIKKRD